MYTHYRSAISDWISAGERQALNAPIERAQGLPGRTYSEGFYALEQLQLFPRTWAVVGVGADIPNPGDARAIDLAGTPLVMVRQRDGQIKLFHNQCRHRGMAVVTASCERKQVLVCPWHGWVYELSGALRVPTRVGGETTHACKGFEPKELGLVQVRSARWHDWIFANLDGNAPEISDYLAPLDALLQGINLDVLEPGEGWAGSYPGNWKLAVEGGVEDYHLPMAHPQLFNGVSSRGCSIATGSCFSATIGEPVRNAPVGRPSSIEGVPMRADQRGRSFVVNVFPTGILLLHENWLMLGVFTPNGHQRTRIQTRMYFHPTAFGDGERDAWRKARAQALAEIVEQDHDFVRAVHNNAAARDRAGIATRFSPYWEGAVLHFQRLVIATLDQGRSACKSRETK